MTNEKADELIYALNKNSTSLDDLYKRLIDISDKLSAVIIKDGSPIYKKLDGIKDTLDEIAINRT